MNHTQWKYHVTEIGLQLFGASAFDRIREELDKRGALGWELVTVAHNSNNSSTWLYFKKPA
ncbi:DUF4177 domain-containing protein [Lysobacter sp. cf310]|uniref:DUF4177 domain-containing protein n=1 Tax=Lysobacter sp. cf310 TaxID=1761790 RepID=UPI0008F39601|nr:DUF4177 domain-containing protein [Lysobacter sp. cf310]SFK78692.1 protein of unknown function [Lysobacter sp. cf310]